MDTRGAAPRPSTVRDMANILLAARGESLPATVGKNWLSSFVNGAMSFEYAFLDDIIISAL
jgi:hypothetical protein